MRAFHLSYLIFIFVVGCSSVGPRSNQADGQIINTASSQRVNDASSKAETTYASAQSERFEYFAPNTWRKVKRNMSKMRDIVKEFDPDDQGFFGGPSEEKVMRNITEAQASLNKAKQQKELVQNFLKQPLSDIDYIKPKVNSEWSREFTSINKNLVSLIKSIEKNNNLARHLNKKNKLQERINKLEINIIKSAIYLPLSAQLEELNKRLIPVSYTQTEQDLHAVDLKIQKEPRNEAAIASLADIVKNDLRRSQHVSTDVSWINSVSRSKRESIVLHYRNHLEALGKRLFNIDLSTYSFPEQVQKLGEMIALGLQQNETLSAPAATEQETVTPVSAAIKPITQEAETSTSTETNIQPAATDVLNHATAQPSIASNL